MTRVTLTVPEISCEHCEHAITEALQPVPGVQSVQVDIEGKLVKLEYDEGQLSIDKVKEILAEEEYPVVAVNA
ncbi:MAG: copper chaperone [Chloroflexota bacterium]|jgi:copper chaperone CopZ|nr:copper chaperone [Chloroflexota bacterium]